MTLLAALVARARITAHFVLRDRVTLSRLGLDMPTPFTRWDWKNEKLEPARVLLCLVAELCESSSPKRARWIARLRSFLGEEFFWEVLEAIEKGSELGPESLAGHVPAEIPRQPEDVTMMVLRRILFGALDTPDSETAVCVPLSSVAK